ncbi:hypothetical protein CPB83DRAFT_935966, partial [Crepidotus variabilis]
LIGYFLNWALFGVLSMQIYVYYLAFPHDRFWSYSIYLLETIQTIMLTQSAFRMFAQGFGNLLYLDNFGTIWFSVPILSGIVAFMAQTLYAYRIKVLSRSSIIASVVFLLAVIQLGGGIASGIISKRAVFESKFIGAELYITTGIWNGCSALCDILIAACMTFYLVREDTGVTETRRMVRKIVRLAIETGSLTAIVALMNFVLTLVPGHLTYYTATASVVGKLYSNSLMAIFNSRMRLKPEGSKPPISVEFSGIAFGHPQAGSHESNTTNDGK